MKKIIFLLISLLAITNAFSAKIYKAYIKKDSLPGLNVTMLNRKQIYDIFPFIEYFEINNILISSPPDKKGDKQYFSAKGTMSLIRRDIKTGYFRYRIEFIPLERGGELEGRFSINEGKLKFDETNSYEIYIEGYIKRMNGKITFNTLPTQKLFAMQTFEHRTIKAIMLQAIKNIPVTIEVEKEVPNLLDLRTQYEEIKKYYQTPEYLNMMESFKKDSIYKLKNL